MENKSFPQGVNKYVDGIIRIPRSLQVRVDGEYSQNSVQHQLFLRTLESNKLALTGGYVREAAHKAAFLIDVDCFTCEYMGQLNKKGQYSTPTRKNGTTFTIMKYITILSCLAISCLFFIQPTEAVSPNVEVKDMDVFQLTDYWVDYYGVNHRDFYSTMMCESGGNVNIPGDNGHAFGPLQIHQPTFERWERKMGVDLDYSNWRDHIQVGAWAFSQGDEYRNQWTMYVALKNGGEYSFYSKLLGKHFTVYCNYAY